MRAHLAHLALVHHDDLVGALDGRKPVGDDQRGASLDQPGQRLAHPELGIGVHAGGRLIEDQDARVVGQRAGKRDQLLLPGGERVAALLQQRVEALAAASG